MTLKYCLDSNTQKHTTGIQTDNFNCAFITHTN